MKTPLLAALALALAAPALPAAAQADFSKFVTVGASVDAGFIDSCWVKHGQTDSWPAIFARQTGNTAFQQPIVGRRCSRSGGRRSPDREHRLPAADRR